MYRTTPSPALDVLHHQRKPPFPVLVMQYIQSWGGSGLVHETRGGRLPWTLVVCDSIGFASSALLLFSLFKGHLEFNDIHAL
jgi:hypothetical protein